MADDHDQTDELTADGGNDLVAYEPTAMVAYEPPPPPAPAGGADIHPEDPDDDWLSAAPPTGVRMRLPTIALVGLLLLAGGFWVGAYVQKHDGTTSASSVASALASRISAARGTTGAGGLGFAGGAGGFAGRAGSGTTGAGTTGSGSSTEGLVTDVKGDTIDITTSSGQSLTVAVRPTTRITKTVSTSVKGLAIGTTVVVQGTRGSGGTIAATSITASNGSGG